MKTAISMPDDVFEAADAAARRTGISRSQLFVAAIRLFLRNHGDKGVTERLNEVYADVESGLDPELVLMQVASTRTRKDW